MDAPGEKLRSTKPREKDGARTGARFAFQAHVSISKILEWHADGIDYVALFDLHDDLTLIERNGQGSRLHFFQIKAKGSGAWTSNSLASPNGKKAPRTIVGKMYHNIRAFDGQPSIATFVTNTSFSFTLQAGRKTNEDDISIALSTLGTKDRETISNGLQIDFPSPRNPDESDVLQFEITKMPSRHYDDMLLGEITKLCPAASSAIGLYRTLVAEVTKRANDTRECTTLEEIYERKSLSRGELASLLDTAKARVSILDQWSEIDEELKAEGRTLRPRVELKTQVVLYLERIAKGETSATALSKLIQNKIGVLIAEVGDAPTYLSAAKKLRAAIDWSLAPDMSDIEIEAALFTEIHEAL